MGRHVTSKQMAEVQKVVDLQAKLAELGLLVLPETDGGNDSPRALIEANEGSELLAGAVETETDFVETIERVLRKKLRNDALVEAIKKEEEALKERRKAIEERSDKLKDLIGWLVNESGLPSLETIFGKVSPKALPDEVVVPVESHKFIQQDYWVEQPARLDLVSVKKHVLARHKGLAAIAQMEDGDVKVQERKKLDLKWQDIPHTSVITDRMSFQLRR